MKKKVKQLKEETLINEDVYSSVSIIKFCASEMHNCLKIALFRLEAKPLELTKFSILNFDYTILRNYKSL